MPTEVQALSSAVTAEWFIITGTDLGTVSDSGGGVAGRGGGAAQTPPTPPPPSPPPTPQTLIQRVGHHTLSFVPEFTRLALAILHSSEASRLNSSALAAVEGEEETKAEAAAGRAAGAGEAGEAEDRGGQSETGEEAREENGEENGEETQEAEGALSRKVRSRASAAAAGSAVRSLCLRVLTDLIEQFHLVHDFREYGTELWAILATSIATLPATVVGAYKPPAVLALMQVSCQPKIKHPNGNSAGLKTPAPNSIWASSPSFTQPALAFALPRGF